MKYVLALLALLLAGVGAYVVFALPGQPAEIEYKTISIQLGDPERVRVTFEVTKDPAKRAECQVTATGEQRDVVNRLAGIQIPPAATRTTRHTVSVPTDQLATDATVTYCAITG